MEDLEELREYIARLDETYSSVIPENHCIAMDVSIIAIRVKMDEILARIERLLLSAP